MSIHLSSQVLTITCQGPVHVGSGETLDPTGYIYDQKNKRAYFLNEPAWVHLLASRRLLPSFIDYVKQLQLRKKPLYDWCEANRLTTRDFEQVSVGWAHVPVQPDRDIRYLNTVSLLTRSADGRPYIPGSSIKGALRSAILHHLIKRLNEDQKLRYWQDFVRLVTQSPNPSMMKKEAKRLIDQLEQNLLHRLNRMDDRSRPVPSSNAVNSVLQGLRVSDAYPVDSAATHLIRKVDWQIVNEQIDPEKYLPLTRECLAPGTKLSCRLTIEPALLAPIGISSIGEVMEAATAFTQHVLALEKSAFASRLRSFFTAYEASNLVIGGGTGFLDKTLVYNLAPKEEARKTVALILDKLFTARDRRTGQYGPAHRHVALDKILSPRTLKLGKLQINRHRMGICRMGIESC